MKIDRNDLVDRMLKRETMSMRAIEEIRPQTLMTGPIITHQDLGTIDRSQKELQKKLAYEADKLFRREYIMRAGIYRYNNLQSHQYLFTKLIDRSINTCNRSSFV